jgi:hypothetical protein
MLLRNLDTAKSFGVAWSAQELYLQFVADVCLSIGNLKSEI